MRKIVFVFGFLAIFIAFSQIHAEENNSNIQKKEIYYKNKFIVGGNLLLMNSSSELDVDGSYKISNNVSIDESDFGAGINARYKIYFQKENKNSIFLTPEVFYNFASTSGSDNVSYGMFGVELKQSYGAKLSLGIEFDNKHSFSVGGIVQNISHNYSYSLGNIKYDEDDDSLAFGFALDYEYQMMKHLSINFGGSASYASFSLPNSNLTLNNRIVSFDMNNTIVNLYVGLNYIF